MTNPVIPEEAVEAALVVLLRDDLWELSDEEEARLILEAAAPHMLGVAWDDGFRRGNFWHGWIIEPTTFAPDFTNPYRSQS